MTKKKLFNSLLLLCSLILVSGVLFNATTVLAQEPQRALFVGDDTLQELSVITKDSPRFQWFYEKRKGLTWVRNQEKEFLKKAKQGDVIIFSFGLGEVSNYNKTSEYISYFNKFAKDNGRKYKIYVKSVDPVDESKYGIKVNDKIRAWNEQIQKNLSGNITYIDTYAGMGGDYSTLSNGYHYDGASSQRLLDFILKAIGMPSDQELREREANSKDLTEGGTNTWGRDKYGERVFYDENGAIVKNTLKDINGATYFFDKEGHYVKGIYEFESYTAFFNEVGIMTKGKTAKVDKEHLMLFDDNGHQVKDKWQEVNGKRYYIDDNGYALVGWWTLGTTDYYFTEDGSVAKGITPINGDVYWFNDDGSARVGWFEEGSEKYYFGEGGKMVTGEQKIAGKYYHFKSDGQMATGWVKKEDGHYYYDLKTGVAAEGKVEIDGKIYFFSEKGKLQHGWIELNGSYYFYKEDGTFYSGRAKIGEYEYFFDTEGKMLTGWQGEGKEKRYFDEETGRMAVGWKKIDGDDYYFKEDGSFYNGGLHLVDGSYRWFSEGVSVFGIPAILVNIVIFAIVVGILWVLYIKNKIVVDNFVQKVIEKITDRV